MDRNQALTLQNRKPICYLLDNSHLQQSLPYIDQDYSQMQSKIAYMIKMQQRQTMSHINPYDYIKQLKLPQTPFINSVKFHNQVQRVKAKLNSQTKKDKNKNKVTQIDRQKLNKSKLSQQNLRLISKDIDRSIIREEQCKNKNVHLQLGKMISPLLMKEFIQSLQTEKLSLSALIDREKQEIRQINRLRKYQQLQARQREQTVDQRVKLMVNKRRKIQ